MLIGQIGHGGGTALVQQVKQRQQKHVTFINELDEPSAKIFNTSLHSQQQQQQSLSEVTPVEDKTAVYTFSVDHSHPFHRHEGHRVFTAVTGSSGCYLRFSTATTDELNRDPSSFFSQLSQVQIPGDCIFTLRFNGKVWHQFAAKEKTSPAFFAISVHTDETGGQLSAELQSKVRANESSIASLTELVPDQVQQLMSKDQKGIFETIPTYQLSLEPGGPSSFRDWYCRVYRSTMGVLRTFASELLSKMRGQSGYIVHQPPPAKNLPALKNSRYLQMGQITKQDDLPLDSILRKQLPDYHMQDCFTVRIYATNYSDIVNDEQLWVSSGDQPLSDALMERLLGSFVDDPPTHVGRFMQIRNTLVTPFNLRTSSLSCPVSSLLGNSDIQFGKRRKFPVRDCKTDRTGDQTQVTLGANDKHLRFRSVVSVKLIRRDCNDEQSDIIAVDVSLSNRVQCSNVFGRLYMWSIHYGHENMVVPPVMYQACRGAFQKN